MGRHRRYGKIQVQDQPLCLSPAAPNSETKTLEGTENATSNGVTIEVKAPEKQTSVRKKPTSLAVRRSCRIVNTPVRVNYVEMFENEVDVAAAEVVDVAIVEEIDAADHKETEIAAAEDMDTAVVEKISVAEDDKVEDSLPDEENYTHEETEHEPEPAETTNAANLNYKDLYIRSQKKIRALTKKNTELSKQLEKALAMIEVYTEMTPIISSMSKSNEILCKREGRTKRFRT